jgi:hypothetical protein
MVRSACSDIHAYGRCTENAVLAEALSHVQGQGLATDAKPDTRKRDLVSLRIL